ncbi:hypothetical protein SAMN02745165_02828 [Malonomonas rubra DSM 5091]|uniref:Uncharacterized protein n=1 Tax=Malonomonas rubra DSM 5091 TaxID=1122189 RepID=A0A1M6KWZ3_MALRU|nr:hypothetical protein SAMN02745165_02828 [Malonomonas rubra DSM 5091]
MGIYIHNVKDPQSGTDFKGSNPFDNWYVERDGQKVYFSSLYKTYDWVSGDGYNNLSKWIEAAAKDVGR